MTQARLQFRWEATDKPADEFGTLDWICKYELSIPLDTHDIRREDDDYNKVRDAQVIELGSTKRGSCQIPCVNDDGSFYFDAPYRDGAHATWDAPKLGNLPIVCIAIDGTVIPKPIKPEDTPPQAQMTAPAGYISDETCQSLRSTDGAVATYISMKKDDTFSRPVYLDPPPQEQKRVKLPPIGDELYEHYPAMSAQTHADLVKDYAREAVRAALANVTNTGCKSDLHPEYVPPAGDA